MVKERNVPTEARINISSNRGLWASATEDMTIPLLTNPLNPGAPDMEREAMRQATQVTGISLANPPSSVSFLFPVM